MFSWYTVHENRMVKVFASCNALTKLGKVDLEKRDRNAKIKKFYEKLVTTQPF